MPPGSSRRAISPGRRKAGRQTGFAAPHHATMRRRAPARVIACCTNSLDVWPGGHSAARSHSLSSRPKSRDPYAQPIPAFARTDRDDTAYGSLLSQGRHRDVWGGHSSKCETRPPRNGRGAVSVRALPYWLSSRPKSRDPYAAADREGTAYGSLLSQGRHRDVWLDFPGIRAVRPLTLSRGRGRGRGARRLARRGDAWHAIWGRGRAYSEARDGRDRGAT